MATFLGTASDDFGSWTPTGNAAVGVEMLRGAHFECIHRMLVDAQRKARETRTPGTEVVICWNGHEWQDNHCRYFAKAPAGWENLLSRTIALAKSMTKRVCVLGCFIVTAKRTNLSTIPAYATNINALHKKMNTRCLKERVLHIPPHPHPHPNAWISRMP